MRSRSVQKLIDEYMGKVTSFAHLKMSDHHDAEDLAQDIMLQLISSLNRDTQIDNLDAYVWKVSCNVLNRHLRRKHHATYIELTGLERIEDSTLDLLLSREEIALVRREVALLSSAYRDAVIRYYYDGQSVREIARVHGVSEGTVKWWLFEARKQLRKGVEMMRPNGQRSLEPDHLRVGINGGPGRDNTPFSLINGNLLAQNILLAAYRKPLDEAALSQELGVSRPYVESEVERLVSGELLSQMGPDAFQTDFAIADSEIESAAREAMELAYRGIRPRLVEFIEEQIPVLMEPPADAAGFSAERVRWVAVLVVGELLSRTTFAKILEPPPTPERPAGGKWIALGTVVDEDKDARSLRYGFNGPMSSFFGDGTYGIRLLLHQFSGFDLDNAGWQLIMNPRVGVPVFSISIELAKQQLNEEALGELEKDALAEAIRWQLIAREDGKLRPNFLFIPQARLDAIEASCAEFGQRLLEPLRDMIERVNAIVREHSPEHVWWQVPVYSSSYYSQLMPMLLDDYYKEGRLSEPREEDKHLLSFYLLA